MENEFRYEIGGKTYIQRPLVLGQARQLGEILQEIIIPGDVNAGAMINILGDALPEALAIVLNPEGQSLRDKDIPSLAEEFEFAITGDQVMQVLDDFFTCNPIASYLERLTGMLTLAQKKMPRTGLKKSASSSPEETLPGGTPSSGDTPSKSASPGSDTAPEM